MTDRAARTPPRQRWRMGYNNLKESHTMKTIPPEYLTKIQLRQEFQSYPVYTMRRKKTYAVYLSHLQWPILLYDNKSDTWFLRDMQGRPEMVTQLDRVFTPSKIRIDEMILLIKQGPAELVARRLTRDLTP